MNLEWNEEYSVGILSIDTQHKKILNYLKELDQILATDNKNDSKIMTIYQNMLKYTKSHFLHEEKLFQAFGYPDREEHEVGHQNLLISLENIGKTLSTREKYSGKKFRELLYNWFLIHIVTEDKKYAQYLKEHGAI